MPWIWLSRCSQTLSEPGKVTGAAKAVVIPQGSQASGALAGRSLRVLRSHVKPTL